MVSRKPITQHSPLNKLGQILPSLLLAVALVALLLKVGIQNIIQPHAMTVRSGVNHIVGKFVSNRLPDFMRGTKGNYGLVVAIDPADFSCPPCFEDFLRLSDQMRPLVSGEEARRGLYLLRQSGSGPWGDSVAVQRWAQAQDLPFPIMTVPETTYTQFKLSKTTAMIVDPSLQTVFMERIPLTKDGYARIQFLMEEK